MADGVSTIVDDAWPEAVLRCAADLGVDEQLPEILALTRRIFPDAEQINVLIEDDPEIADDRHLVFEVALPTLTAAEVVRRNDQWHRELIRCCPPAAVCVFRLGLLTGQR